MSTKPSKTHEIPESVKKSVWNRDGGRCVICGSTYTAAPNTYYIPPSSLGRKVEENIVTMCLTCRCDYDQSAKRPYYAALVRQYLKLCYPNWDEGKLTHHNFDAIQTYYELSDKGRADVDNYIKLTYKEENHE